MQFPYKKKKCLSNMTVESALILNCVVGVDRRLQLLTEQHEVN